MWILVQTNDKHTKRKYVASVNYDRIIKYINLFNNVKKYNDYYFVSDDKEIIEFNIYLGESLDGRS